MVLTALRGALGFLSRIPVGTNDHAWSAFQTTPVTFPLVGYLLGTLLLIPLLLPLPAFTTTILFILWLYTLTGITHLDGLADMGDAIATHGDPETRRAAMKDTTTGVGALLAIAVILIGLAGVLYPLTALPLQSLLLVVTAEVSAKLSMTILTSTGTTPHDGLGAELTTHTSPRSLLLPVLVAIPAAGLTWPNPAAAISLLAAPIIAITMLRWANNTLGGINGDIIGASNEITRVVALHLGVLTWMQY